MKDEDDEYDEEYDDEYDDESEGPGFKRKGSNKQIAQLTGLAKKMQADA